MTQELIFGNDEWKEELSARVTFPQMFLIYYGKNKTFGDEIIHVMIHETKSTEPKNLKVGALRPNITMAIAPYTWAFLQASYIQSAEEYIKIVTSLADEWGVKLRRENVK